jgi:hypothetical protein
VGLSQRPALQKPGPRSHDAYRVHERAAERPYPSAAMLRDLGHEIQDAKWFSEFFSECTEPRWHRPVIPTTLPNDSWPPLAQTSIARHVNGYTHQVDDGAMCSTLRLLLSIPDTTSLDEKRFIQENLNCWTTIDIQRAFGVVNAEGKVGLYVPRFRSPRLNVSDVVASSKSHQRKHNIDRSVSSEVSVTDTLFSLKKK